MITIKTRDYGTINVPKDSAVYFKKPLFGFEHLKEFYLIHLEEPEHFYLLQSKEDENISFVLTEPRVFIKDYILDIDDHDFALLETNNHDDIADFAIITIPENIEDITMNILGPVIINIQNNFAIQSVSNCPSYTTRCGLFQKEEILIAAE